MESRYVVASVLALASALAACDKATNPTPPATSQESAASATPPAPPAEHANTANTAASASAAVPSARGAESAAPSPTESAATAKASAKDGGGAAPAGSAAAAECGTKPLPDCPLQAWMKANINPPLTTNDMPGLAAALDKVVAFAPGGYTNWASIAKDGANAARANDAAAAKASCRTCHDQYKAKYRTDMRARKI